MSKLKDMTIKDWVERYGKSEYNIYCDFYEFMTPQKLKPSHNYGSWYGLEAGVQSGNTDLVQKALSVLQNEYEVAKTSLQLYNRYKGEKKHDKIWYNTHLSFDKGVLILSENITPASLLKMSRLLRDANARCEKHPVNANVGL